MTLKVEISLFGFGDDRPPFFEGRNQKQLILDKEVSARSAMMQAGFSDFSGLVLMRNNSVIAENLWEDTALHDGDKLKVLSAFEGG